MVADPRGFLRHGRVDPAKRPVPVRLRDWRLTAESPDPEQVRDQALRCMDCGVAFCHHGCPLGNEIPRWNELVARNVWREASISLHGTNNFPEFTGSLCPAPCEASCVLAINDDAVAIKQVELAIAERALAEGWLEPGPADARAGASGCRVAVIGSGPAGLTVAQQLARAGHAVTVYERADRPGGLLRYGIPDFKMDKALLDRRLHQLRCEGVQLRCGVDVGRSVAAAELRRGWDAVVLACGAPTPRALELPGDDLDGVHFAMDYLPHANRVVLGDVTLPGIDARGRRVAIIGGGDTGADCLGTANRQGAVVVHQLDHNPLPPVARDDAANPWPQWPRVHRHSPAHEEGVVEAWGAETTSLVGDGSGRVRAVRGRRVQVRWRGGARVFEADPDGDFEVAADLVLVAVGFLGVERGPLLEGLGVELAPGRCTVAVDSAWRTTAPGVYACGDATRGSSLVVWAIAEARSCASAVDADLTGHVRLPAPVRPGERPV